MNLNEWFHKGISKKAYMSRLDKRYDGFHTVYNNFTVPAKDQAAINDKSDLRVIVLAEPWCGHCMMNVPILLNIAESANIPVSFLLRDDHLELMDQYKVNGKRYIPIFIFIDKDGHEVSRWGPMAPKVVKLADDMKETLPSKEDPGYQEAFRSYANKITELFTKDNTYWVPTYESIKKAMI